ncbi:MAG: hypothetical protein FJY76_03600 [Candidatus Aenigmarchaeota archaeon]|nr:hypothetical protein [Candidatus Aenigmarchaeota archaeon]
MTTATSDWEKLNPKEKANLLKGDLSYAEHYGYLMDWYMKDRKETDRIRGGISLVPEDHVRESLKDVLEALKECDRFHRESGMQRSGRNAALNQKVEGGYARTKAKGSIFSRLCA